MKNNRDTLDQFNYKFPNKFIAQSPASPRDSARLLVYNRATKEIQFSTFRRLARALPPKSVLVFNQTKVIPARFTVTKTTGSKVTFLYLSKNTKLVTVLSDRKLTLGMTLMLTRTARFKVHAQQGKYYYLKPLFPLSSLIPLLSRYGCAPLPPYIKHSPLSHAEQKKQYQTFFARTPGSIAAPTASLHFTKRLLNTLKRAGHDVRFVTLHVNLGTFAPVTDTQLKNGKLHTEYYSIDRRTASFLNRAKQAGRPIIAVGTTVVRTLESAVDTPPLILPLSRERSLEHQKVPPPNKGEVQGGGARIKHGSGVTDLFIQEGYQYIFINHLITNFHVPRSSLLMLVSAFAGRKTILNLYQTAIARQFRLFSFGDGMLIL